MAPSFDCAVSSLLCAEEEESLVYDDDLVSYEEFDDMWQQHGNHQTNNYRKINFYDKILNDLPMQTEECVALMISKECEHLPARNYLDRLKNRDLDLDARNEAIDWIQKVHGHFNFQPLCLYLSVNYLDRFLSAYELPAKTWMMQLLAVACTSLACKMEETDVPPPLGLQVVESKFIFEGRTIGRMELLVLSTLKWRMQAITPFSYLDFFLKKINANHHLSNIRATQIILNILNGIDFLDFRPSEIAAAAAICATRETQALENDITISALIQHVEKDRIIKCGQLMHGFSSLGGFTKGGLGALAPSVPQSPIGVLDAVCFSHKTDETAMGSCANSCHNSPVAKRRKNAEDR